MKIRKLKEITILTNRFKIKWDKRHNAGSFHFKEMKMNIGIQCIKKNPEHVFQVLVHELSEAVHCCIRTRYDDPSCDTNYKFYMDHKEFEVHNILLSELILKFIK